MKLREPLDIINSSSRVKLKADPTDEMWRVRRVAENCLRHHPTLALSTWRASLAAIRTALESMEDIYDSAEGS